MMNKNKQEGCQRGRMGLIGDQVMGKTHPRVQIPILPPNIIKNKIENKWVTKKPLYIEKTDKRYKKYVGQLKKDGFCDCETWNLEGVISEFILPRLKRFRELANGHPMSLTMEQWWEILDKMIFAFEWNLTYDDISVKMSESEQKKMRKKYNEGMKLFGKWFLDLWW